MMTRRPAAVAGLFYPDDPAALNRQIDELMDGASAAPQARPPRALVVPHAGYPYSGPVAAEAYARIAPFRDQYKRVLLLGPSHRVPFRGMALSSADRFTTPLGDVAVDEASRDQLLSMEGIEEMDAAHAMEHSLEVQLPFLQRLLDDFRLIPLSVGDAPLAQIVAVIEHFWDDPETLVVISTDLSHFLTLEQAEAIDDRTRQAIEQRDYRAIGDNQACGRYPLRGLLSVLERRGLAIETLAMGTSADTTGDASRVVGYGAWVVQ